ncbi:hypothetical protein K1719_045096 [Acacia pycnantha]|nr:hypothetical protein K1719_045096 [Acacia pycnantha]
MIVNENTQPLAKLELIDDVQRLGLGHRFDNEIKDALHTYVSEEETRRRTKQSISLHEAALSFRLLRDHGYHASPEIFESFKNQNGNFKACLSNDVKGMLSLYEATFLGHQGEDILEEAKAFTTTHLSEMNQHRSNDHVLSQAISHALDLPVHRRTRSTVNSSKGSPRDVKVVEGDGTSIELFTAAVERWDINAIHVLPKYMKVCFLALYNTVNEMTYEALKEQGHNILPYLTKAWSDMLKAFLQEARWSHEKQIPSFDAYFKNAWMSVSGVVFLVNSYFFLNHNFSEESLQSLDANHGLLRCPSVIFRLCNDLGTSKAELERGEAASSINLNKARGIESKFSKAFVETALDLARISHCTYQYGDGHGAPDTKSKNRVRLLIVEPIRLRG